VVKSASRGRCGRKEVAMCNDNNLCNCEFICNPVDECMNDIIHWLIRTAIIVAIVCGVIGAVLGTLVVPFAVPWYFFSLKNTASIIGHRQGVSGDCELKFQQGWAGS